MITCLMKFTRSQNEKSFECLKHICEKLCSISKEDEFVKQLIYDKMFADIRIYSSAPNVLGKKKYCMSHSAHAISHAISRIMATYSVNYRVQQIALVLQPILPPSLKSASYSEELFRQLALIPPGKFTTSKTLTTEGPTYNNQYW